MSRKLNWIIKKIIIYIQFVLQVLPQKRQLDVKIAVRAQLFKANDIVC